MDLVLKVSTHPPKNSTWHDPDPQRRGEWSQIYEITSTWFCSSHTFNKSDNLIILYEQSLIKLEGANIRYLGPSLRSSASLLHKAFGQLLSADINDNAIFESTPGIWIYPFYGDYQLPLPYYQLNLSDTASTLAPREGSLFCFEQETSQQYYAPASRISQALVWYLQSR